MEDYTKSSYLCHFVVIRMARISKRMTSVTFNYLLYILCVCIKHAGKVNLCVNKVYRQFCA